MEGTMIWFNRSKQHGFVRTDDGERLRVDESGLAEGALFAGRCGGMRVSFERIGGELDEPRAVGLTVAPPAAAGRARRRGGR
jgi:cold shock CspA family protein